MNFECVICNEMGDADGSNDANGLCAIANCGHVLHKKCMADWTRTNRGNSTCPTCRQKCEKIWTLYGATKVTPETARRTNGEASGAVASSSSAAAPAAVPALNGVGDGGSDDDSDAEEEDHEDVRILNATLREDIARLTRQLRDAHLASRLRDRNSDQKDLQVLRLRAEVKECHERIEDLETKLALSESILDS